MSLSSLSLFNFTAFSRLKMDFSPGLNVIIGENATGKSHLLKLAYVVAYVLHESRRTSDEAVGHLLAGSSKSWFQRRIAEKLVGVFRPDSLGRLCRRGIGRSRTEIFADFGPPGDLNFSFASNSQKDVVLLRSPANAPHDAPIFFPPKEVMSFYPGFASLYEQREIHIDETYYDLCKLLSVPLLRGKYASEIADIVKPLTEIMGGFVRVDSGRFYLHLRGQGKMEISLIAEGLRKVAALAYLAANGSLTNKGILFWDEPEANLNPKIITSLAKTLTELANKGVQVILATHSLFVMKELSLLVERSKKQIPARFFSLRLEEGGIALEEGELLEDLQTIVALDEVLSQDDREQSSILEEMQ
ncbi:hypothetical protein Desti_2147 [Desulfomonile tiedjei DSM 6799]|uniref:Uncharacterized protein n=1 Tax=Desulfomonile tiedjei (strain ATCC 49306 / DSM 6799 / DCB-1) TaxID=706587 RepID=I4C5K4_DESTA|nr:hypothetical protein Desti_2147 [Desulfomonile tiedjei DSM 6799]